MDVQKILALAILCTSGLTACSDPAVTVQDVSSSFEVPKCKGASAITTEFIVHWKSGHFSVESGKDPESFREDFIKPRLDEIQHVQINQVVSLNQEVSVDSADVESASVRQETWGLEQIQAESVWSQGFRGQGIRVGIIDSQVDVNHTQLRPRIAVNTAEIPGNSLDDDRNGVVDDYWGAGFFSPTARRGANEHGTHVAGIVAAAAGLGPMTGVAPEAQLIPAAFLDDSGGGTLGDAILAMQYAASRGARVLNASWGGSGCDDSLARAFGELSAKGALLVVAAGNSGLDIDVRPFFPASFDLAGQITVGANDMYDFMTSWSNSGFRLVHLTAPGDAIFSTGVNNGYLSMSGTSMAAPFVAGAAAVLWSARPQASSVQIKQALLAGVDRTPGKLSKTLTRGRLNLSKSFDELRRIVP